MSELIDKLGLPAAVAVVLWAAYGGIRVWRELHKDTGDTRRATREAVQRILDHIDDLHRELIAHGDKSREDLEETMQRLSDGQIDLFRERQREIVDIVRQQLWERRGGR